jgi:hypothetical protein
MTKKTGMLSVYTYAEKINTASNISSGADRGIRYFL